MVTVCWSVKGGSGVSVVAAALALASQHRHTDQVLLVDLAGDAGLILGAAEAGGPGVLDWLAAPDVGVGAVPGLIVPVTGSVSLLPAGRIAEPVAPGEQGRRLAELAEWLTTWPGPVVVDAGTNAALRHPLIDRADRSVLVLRLCFLAVQAARAVIGSNRADDLVIVEEPGRSLTCGDVAFALGVAVAARIPVDPSIGRSVDAGLLTARMPRMLLRPLRSLVDPQPLIRAVS
jgi:hypothetical protein